METPTPPVPPVPPGAPEEVLWEGHPSQWMNLSFYLLVGLLIPVIVTIFFSMAYWLKINPTLCMVLGALVVIAGPVSFWVVRWLRTKYTHISLTTQRLRIQTGVFSRKTEDMELYRVKDLTLEEPFFQRTFGLASLVLSSTDISTPLVELKGLPGGSKVYEKLRAAVEARRASRRVSVTELE